MEHRHVAASGTLQHRHGMLDFGHRRHAGGDDHRLAGLGAGFQQIVPQEFVGRDLVERDVGFELFDGLKIKWRAGELNPTFARAMRQRFDVRGRQFPRGARTKLGAFRENFGCEQFVQPEELEFYRVTAARRGGIDESQRTRQILCVVARRFGDENSRQGFALLPTYLFLKTLG